MLHLLTRRPDLARFRARRPARLPARLPARFLVGTLAGLLVGCSPGIPGPRTDRNTSWLESDILLGVGPEGSLVATVTVSAPFRHLVFFRDGEGFTAPYRLQVILRDGKRAIQMREWSGEAWADNYDETRGKLALQRTVTMELEDMVERAITPVVEVHLLIDGTRRAGVSRLPIDPGRFLADSLTLGQLAVYRQRNRFAEVPTDFEILEAALPDPERFARRNHADFDYATGPPWLLIRIFDLRKERDSDRINAVVSVRGDGDDDAPRWTRSLEFDRVGSETSVFLELPATAFSFGRNRIRVEMEDEEEPAELEIDNLGLDLSDPRSWKANLEQVRVLATEEEFAELQAARPESHEAAWEAFWDRRDPDPGVAGNPRLETHYQRVSYAREFLRDGFADGALSDRGQIWIRLGKPDVVDTASPGFENYGAYEVWRYNDQGLAFYFRDTDGMGRYRLVWQEGI